MEEETGGLQSLGSQSQTRLSDFHFTDLGAKGVHLGFESHVHVCVLSRVQLSDPVDYSPPGASVHGILQAKILEWVAISFSRGSSRPRDRAQVSCTAGNFFTD